MTRMPHSMLHLYFNMQKFFKRANWRNGSFKVKENVKVRKLSCTSPLNIFKLEHLISVNKDLWYNQDRSENYYSPYLIVWNFSTNNHELEFIGIFKHALKLNMSDKHLQITVAWSPGNGFFLLSFECILVLF